MTYGLPETIIHLLAPLEIHRATKVCKTWHQLIEHSKVLRLARALVPVGPPLDNVCWIDNAVDYTNAIYDKGTEIQVHPSLQSRLTATFSGDSIIDHRVYISHRNWAQLSECASAFATIPACQVIGLRTETDGVEFMDNADTGCLVYVRDGIRIRDLMDVPVVLRRQDEALLANPAYEILWSRRFSNSELSKIMLERALKID